MKNESGSYQTGILNQITLNEKGLALKIGDRDFNVNGSFTRIIRYTKDLVPLFEYFFKTLCAENEHKRIGFETNRDGEIVEIYAKL